jgi:hypothetical protein
MNGFWDAVDHLNTAVSRSKAVNVNSIATRGEAADVAQLWFREVRPDCIQRSMTDDELGAVDASVQSLLRLSNARNPRKSYLRELKVLRQARPELQMRIHLLDGKARRAPGQVVTTSLEAGVVATLGRMLPHAALSYQQVILDLRGPERLSYRGTATELREVVREVLDHLAPDESVLPTPGFRLEKDRKFPTMKQKARFILKARGVGDSSRTAPEQSVELLEEQIASLARSVYERGSASTHTATVKSRVLSFKAYADAVLGELLQLHV